MNNPIKAHVAVTYEDYKKFALFGMFRKKRRSIPIFVAYIVFILAYVVYIGLYLSNHPTNYILFALLAVLIVIVVYRLILPLYRIKVNYGKSKLFSGLTGIYVFTEDAMNCKTANDTSSGNGQYGYDAFINAFETKTAFYLYFSDRQALIIPKGNIYEGKPEGLAKILSEKVVNFIKI